MPLWNEDGITEKWGIHVAKATLKVEMAKRNLTYQGLVDVLAKAGIEENERNLRNKVSRGSFSAAFFFQCILAMGSRTLDVSHFYMEHEELVRRIQDIIDEH